MRCAKGYDSLQTLESLTTNRCFIFDLYEKSPSSLLKHLPDAELLYLDKAGFFGVLRCLRDFSRKNYKMIFIADRYIDCFFVYVYSFLRGEIIFIPHGKNKSTINIWKIFQNYKLVFKYLLYFILLKLVQFTTHNKEQFCIEIEYGFSYPIRKKFKSWNIETHHIKLNLDIELITEADDELKAVIVDQPLARDGILSISKYEERILNLATNYAPCAIKLHPRTTLTNKFIIENNLLVTDRIPINVLVVGFNSTLLDSMESNGLSIARVNANV